MVVVGAQTQLRSAEVFVCGNRRTPQRWPLCLPSTRPVQLGRDIKRFPRTHRKRLSCAQCLDCWGSEAVM